MSSVDAVVIAGFGAQTSIGLDTPAVSAAVAGGLNQFRFDRNFRSVKSGARITTSWLETLPKDWLAPQRMKELALNAAKEALQPLLRQGDSRFLAQLRLPVLLALPASRAGFDQNAGQQLAQEIIRGLPIPGDPQRCSAVFAGHAGGITMLSQAAQILAQGNSAMVLVGGVESHREFVTLQSIELAGRLKTEDEALGWIPGEGAGFVLLARQSSAARAGLNVAFFLGAVAVSAEPLPWYSGRATLGAGLTQVLQAVLRVPGAPVETYCDMNGEPWRADEWGYAYLRTACNYLEPLVIHHPAECWGDVGAASGPMLLALAAQNFVAGREASCRALIWTASDVLPYRAACIIQKLLPGGSA